MKYLVLLSFITCITALHADLPLHRVYFEGHSYIANKSTTSFIHDPACGCDKQWHSITTDAQGFVTEITRYYRKAFDKQD